MRWYLVVQIGRGRSYTCLAEIFTYQISELKVTMFENTLNISYFTYGTRQYYPGWLLADG